MNESATHDGAADLEALLLQDRDGSFRAQLARQIERMRDDCAAARRGLHDRETFRKLQAASAAVEAAAAALDLMTLR